MSYIEIFLLHTGKNTVASCFNQLIDTWKNRLHKGKIVDAVLMDGSMAGV